MKVPNLWIFNPDGFDARLEFRFVNRKGELLRSKTWVIHQRQGDPVTTYLLQANAQLAEPQPGLHEEGQNYYVITIKVFAMGDELHTSVIREGDDALMRSQLATHPLSFAIIVAHHQLNFQMHVARSQQP